MLLACCFMLRNEPKAGQGVRSLALLLNRVPFIARNGGMSCRDFSAGVRGIAVNSVAITTFIFFGLALWPAALGPRSHRLCPHLMLVIISSMPITISQDGRLDYRRHWSTVKTCIVSIQESVTHMGFHVLFEQMRKSAPFNSSILQAVIPHFLSPQAEEQLSGVPQQTVQLFLSLIRAHRAIVSE